MPECSYILPYCDLPVNLDTYRGCSFGCKYCFASKRSNFEPRVYETYKALGKWIKGFRPYDCSWCDWDIPLHWGNISDPFQPCEIKYKASLRCLMELSESGYPCVVSTKSTLILNPAYLGLIRAGNIVVQVSMVSERYDILEPNAPSFRERFKMLDRLSRNCSRLLVRVQPIVSHVVDDVIQDLKAYRDAGVYGIIVERANTGRSYKLFKAHFGSHTHDMYDEFIYLQHACHDQGLMFFCGDDEYRAKGVGDSGCCCGVGDMYRVNTVNLNHFDIPGRSYNIYGSAVAFDKSYRSKCNTYSEVIQNLYRRVTCHASRVTRHLI